MLNEANKVMKADWLTRVKFTYLFADVTENPQINEGLGA